MGWWGDERAYNTVAYFACHYCYVCVITEDNGVGACKWGLGMCKPDDDMKGRGDEKVATYHNCVCVFFVSVFAFSMKHRNK